MRCIPGPRAHFSGSESLSPTVGMISRNTEMLVAFGPTRPRSRSKALGRPIGTYDGTCLPARERQRTNWCHGSTEKSDHCFQSAVRRRRSPACRRRRWPKRAFFLRPLVCGDPPSFALPLARGGPGEPKNGSVRSRWPSLRPDGAWTVPRSAPFISPGQERG